MEMKISIAYVIALLAISISTAEIPDYGLYSAGEGTPIFVFQPVFKNLKKAETHGDSESIEEIPEDSNIIKQSLENEEEDDHAVHLKTEADPGEDREKGRIEVDDNRERGQGTRVNATVFRRVWESRDGNVRVDVQGNYGRTNGGPGGTGRPNYGGRITYSHRFRRSLQPRNEDRMDSGSNRDQGRGKIDVNVDMQRGQAARVEIEGSAKVWESPDGNARLDAHGNYGNTFGGPDGPGRPNYGVRVTYSQRFRRSQQPRDQARGNIDVNVDSQRGQGTRVDAHGSGRKWESRDGNGRVDVHGNYGRTYGEPGGTGRPNYGGRITYTNRFRPDAIVDNEQDYSIPESNVYGEESV